MDSIHDNRWLVEYEENSRKVRIDSIGLNIWWNLNILRDALKVCVLPNLVHFSQDGLCRAYASSLLANSSGDPVSLCTCLFLPCTIWIQKGS
jgi:hypothetical protein